MAIPKRSERHAPRAVERRAPTEPAGRQRVLPSPSATEHVESHVHTLADLPMKRTRVCPSRLANDARLLLTAVTPLRAGLLAAGLDAALFDDLPSRITLLEAAHAIRRMHRAGLSQAEDDAVVACKAHRDEMMRVLRFAFRKHPDLLTILASLPTSTGLSSVLEQMRALRLAAEKNATALERTGTSVEAFTGAALVHQRAVGDLVATRVLRTKGGSLEVLRRNQAAHHLLEAVREIRATALFAFPNDAKLRAVLKGIGARPGRKRRTVPTDEPQLRPATPPAPQTSVAKPERSDAPPPPVVAAPTTARTSTAPVPIALREGPARPDDRPPRGAALASMPWSTTRPRTHGSS